jgi:putative tryptophan/tyrosine transport system substrate-binding protein
LGRRLNELLGNNPINPTARAFKQGLRDLGYAEGQDLLLEWRTAEGRIERLPEIMRELVSIKVDLILSGSDAVTDAAHSATRTIPIIMTTDSRPVERGLAQSLAKPGGNVTGLTLVVGLDVYGKRIQLLRELVPSMERLALLIPPGFPFEIRTHIETTSQQLGLKLVRAEHGYLTHPAGVPVWEQRDY